MLHCQSLAPTIATGLATDWCPRIEALLAHRVKGIPIKTLSQDWGFTPACFYKWRQACLLNWPDSLGSQPEGERKAKLTPNQT